MLGSSRVAAQLAASREGLGSMSEGYFMARLCQCIQEIILASYVTEYLDSWINLSADFCNYNKSNYFVFMNGE
jgi:hypothetical protein